MKSVSEIESISNVNKKEISFQEYSIFKRIIFSLIICTFFVLQMYLAHKHYFLNVEGIIIYLDYLSRIRFLHNIIVIFSLILFCWCIICEIIITNFYLLGGFMIMTFIIAFIIEPYILNIFSQRKKIE